MGAILYNAFPTGDTVSRKAKLPLAFLDHPTKLTIDSSVQDYQDWTTGSEDRTSPDEHFVWLSNEFMPFHTDPGAAYELPEFTLGMPDIGDWPPWTREPPWILDPAEHPKPDRAGHTQESADPCSTDDDKKKKKKKHCWARKPELKVTTWGQGDDVPVWSHTGSTVSSSSDSQTEGDSGIGSYHNQRGNAGSTTQHDHTPQYSPGTISRLDRGELEDNPLSDHGGNSDRDQEMASADELLGNSRAEDATRAGLETSSATDPDINLVVVPAVPLMGDLRADTDDEKACWDAYQLILQGFNTATQTLSDSYQQVFVEVQNLVRKSLKKSTINDCTFIQGASNTIHWWVMAVHPAMDCMGESMKEQSQLLQEAQRARKEVTEDVLALLPAEDEPVLPLVIPHCDLLTPALTATQAHMDMAIDTVSEQLSDLVHHHVPPGQAGVFLASLLQMMCSYHQEMDSMATNQVTLPGQIVPNLWGVSQGMIEDLSLLGPPNCLASWLASLVKQITTGPAKKTEPLTPTTPVKLNTPSESGKG